MREMSSSIKCILKKGLTLSNAGLVFLHSINTTLYLYLRTFQNLIVQDHAQNLLLLPLARNGKDNSCSSFSSNSLGHSDLDLCLLARDLSLDLLSLLMDTVREEDGSASSALVTTSFGIDL